jgi:hypothetical protein
VGEGEGEGEGEGGDTCGLGAVASQLPVASGGNAYGSDTAIDRVRAERFTSNGDPIGKVRWWGVHVNDSLTASCEPVTNDFQVTFYDAISGTPGAVVRQETVIPVVTETAIATAGGYIVSMFEAPLAAPLDLAEGWIAIDGTGTANCRFFWQTGAGPQPEAHYEFSVMNGNGEVAGNLSYCLQAAQDGVQSADRDGNFVISLSELLRVIQFYNSLGYHCADAPGDTEDGFVPGAGANQSCLPYDTDYSPQDWVITLSELLRVIQFYNSLGYNYCPEEGTEDGFCPGL